MRQKKLGMLQNTNEDKLLYLIDKRKQYHAERLRRMEQEKRNNTNII